METGTQQQRKADDDEYIQPIRQGREGGKSKRADKERKAIFLT
jgi:hypothetical protein